MNFKKSAFLLFSVCLANLAIAGGKSACPSPVEIYTKTHFSYASLTVNGKTWFVHSDAFTSNDRRWVVVYSKNFPLMDPDKVVEQAQSEFQYIGLDNPTVEGEARSLMCSYTPSFSLYKVDAVSF